MSPRDSDTITSATAIAGIVVIIVAACVAGIDDTLVKLGLVLIAGIAGFSFAGLIRKS